MHGSVGYAYFSGSKSFDMTKPYAVGIDIGGTNTKMGLVDKKGNIVSQCVLSTTGHDTVGEYIDAMMPAIVQLAEQAGTGIDKITGIGVGAPNGNYYTGEVADAPNLPWRGRIPFATLMQERLGFKVTLTNDANAAAVGEMQYGAAKGMKDFIMITLGTGVGSGFVANGQVIYGHTGFAGELGHAVIERNGRQCNCGNKGCMERYCSATGIVITAKEYLAERSEPSLMREYGDKLTAKNIQEAAQAGDKIAMDVFEYTGMILGESLAIAAVITSPQAIVFFGGLAQAGDLILKPTRRHMENNLLPMFKNKIELLHSTLPDADAAILGASALAW